MVDGVWLMGYGREGVEPGMRLAGRLALQEKANCGNRDGRPARRRADSSASRPYEKIGRRDWGPYKHENYQTKPMFRGACEFV